MGYRIDQAEPREEVQEIPEAVFREALLNALTHNAFLVKNFTSFEAAGVSSEGAKLCRWLISHGPASMQDIMGVFHFSKTTAHRRITKLMADGWIKVRGSGRNTKYVLSTDYGHSGKKEER